MNRIELEDNNNLLDETFDVKNATVIPFNMTLTSCNIIKYY